MTPTNNPQQPQPGMLDRLMQFLFGQGALQKAANPIVGNFAGQMPQGAPPASQQSNSYLQNIINAQMQQNAIADALKKKKKKSPTMEE